MQITQATVKTQPSHAARVGIVAEANGDISLKIDGKTASMLEAFAARHGVSIEEAACVFMGRIGVLH